jgi:hypothetical protein
MGIDTAAVKRFIDKRLAGGIGDKDVRDLVGMAGANSAAEKRELLGVVEEYESKFTGKGRATLKDLTGLELRGTSGSSAVNIRAANSIPRGWDQITRVESVVKRLIEEGDSVNLRLPSGRLISLEANEQMIDHLKKGFVKLYKNERDESDVDDNGRTLWYPGYYLVAQPSMKETSDAIEKHSKTADRMNKALKTALESLRSAMHASNVNGFRPYDIRELKAKVASEIVKAKAAIIEFEAAENKFRQDTQLIPYPEDGVWLTSLARDALKVTGPQPEDMGMADLHGVKDLIRANELLSARPEVLTVDPGFGGIRVEVDTNILVANGGDFNTAKAEMERTLKDALITGEVDINRNNNSDKVLEAAQKLLQDKVGAANVRDGYQIGDKDFPDHVRGTEVILYVKANKLAEARRVVDDVKALFAPHGFDMKHFSVRIEEDR